MKPYEPGYFDCDVCRPFYHKGSDCGVLIVHGFTYDRESLMYFQRVLRSSGVIEALEKAGCTDGDTVSILDFEFDFVK